jgi:hypothetical protein
MTRPTPGPDDRFDTPGCAGGLLVVLAALILVGLCVVGLILLGAAVG